MDQELDITERAIRRAEELQNRSMDLITSGEKKRQTELARLTRDAAGKATLTMLTDRSFRSDDPEIIADQFVTVLREHGIPEFFGAIDKCLLRSFTVLVQNLRIPPSYLVPFIVRGVMKRANEVILPGEEDKLEGHLRQRRAEQVRTNLNHLGDTVLGDAEAEHHMTTYKRDLENPLIDYISVKISTLYPHINSLAFDHTVESVSGRLAELFHAAKKNAQNGKPKFINLDMEEYRDLPITLAAFTQTLDRQEFHDVGSGIVLQAYLPDSHARQQELTEWARGRVDAGGAPIKLRIVKGANMAMEKVEASERDWEQAPFERKIDTDSNYYRMVEYGMRPENIRAVNLGIASHNLFSISHAYELGTERGVQQYFTFEMLEGMANHTRRAVQEQLGQDIVLYAPAAKQSEILSALGYLMRRLDENTAPENYLSKSFGLKVGSSEWEFLREQYRTSYGNINDIPATPRRTQNRLTETHAPVPLSEPFRNEPDTDFALEPNRRWAQQMMENERQHVGQGRMEVSPLTTQDPVGNGGRVSNYRQSR